MSAAVKVRLARYGGIYDALPDGEYGVRASWRDWIVDTSSGYGCPIGGYRGDDTARVFHGLGYALGFARAHGAMHTCPSWRASGERCDEHCADCGGAGWIHPNRYDADAAFMLAELGLAVA